MTRCKRATLNQVAQHALVISVGTEDSVLLSAAEATEVKRKAEAEAKRQAKIEAKKQADAKRQAEAEKQASAVTNNINP